MSKGEFVVLGHFILLADCSLPVKCQPKLTTARVVYSIIPTYLLATQAIMRLVDSSHKLIHCFERVFNWISNRSHPGCLEEVHNTTLSLQKG